MATTKTEAPERFNLKYTEGPDESLRDAVLEPEPDGEYVRYSDYDALHAQTAKPREALEGLFCCECGHSFSKTDEWGECKTHPRIRQLIGESNGARN